MSRKSASTRHLRRSSVLATIGMPVATPLRGVFGQAEGKTPAAPADEGVWKENVTMIQRVDHRKSAHRLPNFSRVELDTLNPGDIVYEEPGVDACPLDGLSVHEIDTAVVIVADRQGSLYGMRLRGGVCDTDSKPYGPLYPLDSLSALYATQSDAMMAQAESERAEARERLRIAEQLEAMAAELKRRGR
jgi:hypothetical protein